jgi:RNA polymerase sigma-70 factor (ECF subfamily)
MVQYSKERLKSEFETLAVVHLDYLYNMARMMTGDSTYSEDLVQDTYLRAFSKFDMFTRGTNCLAWLIRIMTNTYINQYNKKKKTPAHQELNHDVCPDEKKHNSRNTEDPETIDDEKLLNYYVSDKVKKAINSLPNDYRIMVILSDLRGLPYQDIATYLGCPLGTVRSRLSRGRTLLKRKLEVLAN